MIERTYINKFATIIQGSDVNTGVNPIAQCTYGTNISRILFQFDTCKIRNMISDKTFPDVSKLKHVIKITNAGSIDASDIYTEHYSFIDGSLRPRASSFDLIFFLIPDEWDRGKGFSFSKTSFNEGFYSHNDSSSNRYITSDGVTWYQSKNGYNWPSSAYTQTTTDRYASFNIKIDKPYVNSDGGKISVKYSIIMNNIFTNHDGSLVLIGDGGENCKISEPIYYDRLGNVCYGETNTKYESVSAEQEISISSNKEISGRTFSFQLQASDGTKTYKSNVIDIFQSGADEVMYPLTDNGIYSNDTLSYEYDRFINGKSSIIIGKQHFDIGNENIDLDITDIFNKMASGEIYNNGIGIAFSPKFERMKNGVEQYVGFLTDKTNTFFAPYIETTYDDSIVDNRADFTTDKTNRLYLYCSFGGVFDNLDEMPVCTIDEKNYPVSQYSKGIYFSEVYLPSSAYTSSVMMYDVWSNIIYKGKKLNDVEMEFTVNNSSLFFNVGNMLPIEEGFTPVISGIKNNDKIKRGDIRKIEVTTKINYQTNKEANIEFIELRLYIKDGESENDVIPFMKINKAFLENYFILDTDMLIPQKYYIDLRIKYGLQSIIHHDLCHFEITDDLNNKYE